MLGKLIPVQGGDSIYLTLPEVTVGSDEGCDVVIQHRSVEPLHCTLEYHDGTWFVEDHGTHTGVRVDGDRFDSTYIPVYSVLSVGTVQFEVHYRAGAPVAVGADSEASNVWPSAAGESGLQFSSGGRLTGEEDELLLAPDDDSGLNLQDYDGEPTGSVPPVTATEKQRLAYKRLGFLCPVDGETPHRLLKERLYLGRDSECDVVVPGLNVAPLHCVMELRDGYWHIRNLRENGVAVDGKKLSESWLIPGAILSICGHEFSVDYEPEGAAPIADTHPDEHTESENSAAAWLLNRNSDSPEDGTRSAAETTSGQSLADLAAEADALFQDQEEAEPERPALQSAGTDLSVSNTASSNAVSSDTASNNQTSVDQPVIASNDSQVEVASSKTFLLFDSLDNGGGAADSVKVASRPDNTSQPISTHETLPAASSNSEQADDARDFELKPASTVRSELPELFDEDDADTNDPQDAPLAGNSNSTADPQRRSATPDGIRSLPVPTNELPASAGPIHKTPDDAAGRSRPEKSRPLFSDSAVQTQARDTVRSDVVDLVDKRHKLLAEYLATNSLDGLVLTRPSSISWLTAGSDVGIGRSNSSALIITRDDRTILHRDLDAPSLTSELLSHLQFKTAPFDWKKPLADRLKQLCSTGHFATDAEFRSDVTAVDASSDLARMRLPMERPERHELRRLGHQVAHAVEATLRGFHRGATEAEIAGQVSNRLFRHGITAEQIQIYADNRRGNYRRIRFDQCAVEDGCTLSVIARRNGLHVATSRTACFGTPDRQILEDHALSLVIQATSLVFSKHHWSVADTWKRVHRIYEKFGRADESLRVEPGWVTGYELCETPILPESDFQLRAGMPVVWQTGVGTALSVDTVLIADGGIDILTPCEFWPTRRVAVKHVELNRPDILIRSDS